jgi:F-type H+-transporting ATPase subunit b
MLDINPILVIVSGLIFLIVLRRLNMCLYQPLLNHMDERSKTISNDLEEAKGNGADVDSYLQEANNIIAEAKAEAFTIKDNAFNSAKAKADEEIATAKNDIEKKQEDFFQSLNSEKESLESSLVANLPDFQNALKAKISNI